ncbi:hypothetical protein LB545_29990 [Mesorhizobium sp. BR1-1-6]|uniref:hypothetical protein n=1 Tax=Mesorhizobium sp. BR1-1-6 TaxID=2876648 RepID=UPI001CD0D83C|nr:hypothetical protein [Mesorhizobium sp. BR1-1-6]MBZ9898544.1 hypothetical protein [Mesorhizobium sp. BR1-1-6]
MNGATVADIVKDQLDFTGAKIETVYSKVSNTYAVYRTPERVMVQFSDDEKLGSEQRLALAPLNPVRGEINGLIDGWRESRFLNVGKKQARARLFDRRTADALTVALQGDQTHAAELLTAVKADILEERTSIGRTEYLIVASICAFVIVVLFGWVASFFETIGKFVTTNDIWLATGVGAIGALFSIALAIRSREIRTDLQRRDNIVDAILRIMIGSTSAVVLFSLFKSGLVTLGLGATKVDLTQTHALIIIAFLAGFAERMVGDFLSTAVLAGTGTTTTEAVAAAQAADKAKAGANEQNPLGKRSPSAETPSADNDDQIVEDAHDHTDGCLCEVDLGEDELMDDVELPEASGGVERAVS